MKTDLSLRTDVENELRWRSDYVHTRWHGLGAYHAAEPMRRRIGSAWTGI